MADFDQQHINDVITLAQRLEETMQQLRTTDDADATAQLTDHARQTVARLGELLPS